jgi:hypothetical protein
MDVELERSIVVAQVNMNLEARYAAGLLGLLVAVDPGFVPQHADGGIDVSRISVADAGLQFQVHVFEASGIFLAEYLRIDRRLPKRQPFRD